MPKNLQYLERRKNYEFLIQILTEFKERLYALKQLYEEKKFQRPFLPPHFAPPMP